VRVAPAASAINRNIVTGARVDRPTGVCAFSRDETADAQVCVDNGVLVDDEPSEWVFGEFPKIDTALANTVKARMNGVKLSPLQYIDVDIEGRQCEGPIDSGEEICVVSEKLASEINANQCGHIGFRGIFSDPLRLPLIAVNIKRGGESNYDNVATVYKLCVPLPH